MKLKFFGAAGFVTGSCHMLSFNGKKVLIDCGMYQGTREVSRLNWEKFHFDPKKIDAVILTHAHIDHSGLLPKLVKQGFHGPIYCTDTTKDLCKIMLEDSAHIQEFETKHDNRRLKREGKPLRQSLYTVLDARHTLKHFKTTKYNTVLQIFPDLRIVFRDAGHILGSAIVECFVQEERCKKIVFSGDVGKQKNTIIRSPTYIKEADYVVCESTYGSRLHEKEIERKKILTQEIKRAYQTGGKLIIPAFAIERTQEILYTLNDLVENNKIPHLPVYVDSPMAVRATRVFMKHTENYNQETMDLLARGDNPFQFDKLTYIEKTEGSKELNNKDGPLIIISASGMCTGGRIKHHLKHNLYKPETTVLFVGYQGKGTLGRRILQGDKRVRIYGESTQVKGRIVKIGGFSSHGDQADLLKWLRYFQNTPKVFFVHGEPDEAEALKKALGHGHVARLYEEVELK